MRHATRKQKHERACKFLKAIDPKKVKTSADFFNNWEYINRRVDEIQAKGLIAEVTDAWGELGSRGYSVIWFTPRDNCQQLKASADVQQSPCKCLVGMLLKTCAVHGNYPEAS